MHATLRKPEDWAQLEFAGTSLGDARLGKRLVQIGAALAQCPSGTLPQAFGRWTDLKAAYRFFSNPNVSYDKILSPHWQQTRQRCTEPGEYLLIEDTTTLDYSSHDACEGLGKIDNGYCRGLLVHTTLAVKLEGWDLEHCPEVTVVGVAAQHCWTRQGPVHRHKKQSRRQQLQRWRESERWGQSLASMPPRPAQATWIYIADRESDCYDALNHCQEAGIDFIVRANHHRRITLEHGLVVKAFGQVQPLGSFELELRARPGQAARRARIEVRTLMGTLPGVWRIGGDTPGIRVQLVEAREVNAPEGQKPIHWVLSTSLGAQNFVQARRIVARYAARWTVEEFHKALKTGANVEKSELETVQRLQALLAVLVVVAVRLLNTKMLARSHPNQKVDAEVFGPEALHVLATQFGEPSSGWTYATLVVAIARMGGFLARRGDGDPGWVTIWRGWQRLRAMTDGVIAMQHNHQPVWEEFCG